MDKILDEIQIIQQQANPYDLKKLQKDIDKQEAKKSRAIQLRLDGEISPSELQTIKEEIDKRIWEIQESIKTAIHFENHQIGCITDCTQRIQEILDGEDTMTDKNVVFLGKMLDRIVVYPQNELEVRLIGVPFGLRLSYFTRGKRDSYRVVVNHQERIW